MFNIFKPNLFGNVFQIKWDLGKIWNLCLSFMWDVRNVSVLANVSIFFKHHIKLVDPSSEIGYYGVGHISPILMLVMSGGHGIVEVIESM